MFILRQFNKQGLVSNMCLGDRYVLIRKESQPKEFERTLGIAEAHPDHEKIFAFLNYKGGSETYPLYKGHIYYIMTESGKTFENIKP